MVFFQLRFTLTANPLATGAGKAAVNGAVFPTTQWSLVLNAGAGADEEVRSALETLCRQYWYPIYNFVRRQGRTHHEAEDFTQQFFARLLSTNAVETARPERGRFRTFLLSALRNFLTDEWRRSQTVKRGGGYAIASIELAHAEQRFAEEPADESLTPDQAFERAWAVEKLGRAMARLREEYESSGRGALFAALAPRLLNSGEAGLAGQSSAEVGLNTHALSMAMNRLRHRLGLRLREEVGATVAGGTDIDAELRLLIAALGTS
jgi:RNA polymerase sigma-70 factor (ECF subfamily)